MTKSSPSDIKWETVHAPKHVYALQGTLNWIDCLSTYLKEGSFNKEKMSEFYSNKKIKTTKLEEDKLQELRSNITLAFNYHAALSKINTISKGKNDLVNVSIIAWYYSIYFSARAMVFTQRKTVSETHRTTAKEWYSYLANQKLTPPPFNLSLSSLIKSTNKEEIEKLRGKNKHTLKKPNNIEEAYGGLCSCLNGTAEHMREKKETKMKKKFRIDHFKSKFDQNRRDKQLQNESVCFLDQAFRHRGKVNYRDAIYLTYSNNFESISKYTEQLEFVSQSFQTMSAIFIGNKIGKETWNSLIKELEANSKLTLKPTYLLIN